jgi:hypothetical protein
MDLPDKSGILFFVKLNGRIDVALGHGILNHSLLRGS